MKNRRIAQLLSGEGENYILPFMWQHGEDEQTLREYVRVIRQSGCRAVCLEARPHPDFAGDGWWHDLDIILEEAQKLDMKVWILDDAHFPTGFAAGSVKQAPDELRKQYLCYARADVCGPSGEIELNVGEMIHPFIMPAAGPFAQPDKKHFDDDTLLHVVAWRAEPYDKMSDPIDLTGLVENGKLYWQVPDGYWKIYVLYTTHNGIGRDDYINMLDEKSCALQIEHVYQPHFAHYGHLFGSVIAGFFSDEPAIGNTVGFDFDESIGRKEMPLPWSRHLPEMMRQRLGENWMNLLPLLWHPAADEQLSAQVRVGYMDTVTRLVERCFSGQLGNWCAEHGVMYIGHLVEDNDVHARLGCSLGHYFRGLSGQHMAGIDNIGNQVLIGGGDSRRIPRFGGTGDGEFYHYELGKLGSSHAHIDPKKQGRALCENFGAYGWQTGVKTMKYLADHFLVRGINYYTPHAFSPKAFPDPDCPPHFYAHGENPQFGAFGCLIGYMNRVCHLINGGISLPDVAVLYHAENEWAGDYQSDKAVCRELMEHQIDFDIIPADLLGNLSDWNSCLKDGQLWLNGRPVQALVIPYAQFIPRAAADFIRQAQQCGFPVFCTEKAPEGVSDLDAGQQADYAHLLQNIPVVPTHQLTARLNGTIRRDISVSPDFRRLTVYHYRSGGDILLLLNEDPGKTFTGEVTICADGTPVQYDALDNCLRPVTSRVEDGKTVLSLSLAPLEMAIISFDGETSDSMKEIPAPKQQTVIQAFTVSRCASKAYPQFTDPVQIENPVNMGRMYPDFSGYYRYEADVSVPGCRQAILTIEDAGETVELFVNGVSAGIRFAQPYRFDISALLHPGENRITLDIATTLERKTAAMQSGQPAFFKNYLASPTGLLGPVTVSYAVPALP